jgi:3-hydroxybutyryl-CoA dehydratase
MTTMFENLSAGDAIEGPKFAVSRESIRLFCDASLDYNPLHLDDDYMKGDFGKTNFGGIIMHGMNNFGLISRMITDWAYPAGAIHRRLETRWLKPVRPGDTIQPTGIVRSKQATARSRWVRGSNGRVPDRLIWAAIPSREYRCVGSGCESPAGLNQPQNGRFG